jgi:hypothetical protein
MFTFFKKKLATDTSAEEIKRITTILEKNKVKYEVRTIRGRGSVGSGLDAHAYASGNLSMYKGASEPIFIYTIHVNLKEYDLARKLIWGS